MNVCTETFECFHRCVEFESREDMLDCLRKADDTELGGKRIRLVEVSVRIFSRGCSLYSFIIFY